MAKDKIAQPPTTGTGIGIGYFVKLAQGPRIGRDGLTMAERWERMGTDERRALMELPRCPKCAPNQSGTPFEDGQCATHWDGPTRDPRTGEIA